MNLKQFSARTVAPWFRRGIAAVMLALFVSVHAMAAFHSLHESVCEHAGAAEHQCAVTLLAAGQIEMPPVDVATVVLAAIVVVPVPALLLVPRRSDRLDPPGRAPPVFFS